MAGWYNGMNAGAAIKQSGLNQRGLAVAGDAGSNPVPAANKNIEFNETQ